MTDFLPYNYLISLLLFLTATVVGMEALDWGKVRFKDRGERLVLSFGLGLGIYSNAVFFLCVIQQLNPFASFLLLLLPLVLFFDKAKEVIRLFHNAHALKDAYARAPKIAKWAAWIFMANLVLVFLGASTPPIVNDALNVHALIPKLYIQHGGFAFLPNHQASNYPCLHVELLYALVMLMGSDTLTQLISVYYLWLMLGTVYLLVRENPAPWAPFCAILLFFFNIDVIIQSSMAWVDMAWNAYALMAFFLIHRWRVSLKEGREDRGSLYLSGVFCGFAAQIKIFAPVIAIIFFLIIIVLLLKDRYPLSLIMKRSWTLAAIAFLVVSPYYLKNVWAFGNPVWPLFQEFFGNKNEALKYTVGMFSGPTWRESGAGVIDFLRFPWLLTIRPQSFHSSPVNPFFLALFPLWFFVKNNRIDYGGLAGLFLLLFIPFWYWQAPEVRFMLVVFALLSIFFAPTALEIAGRDRLIKAILILAAVLWMGAATLGNWMIQKNCLPYVFGLMDRDQYLRSQIGNRFSRRLDWYDAFMFINNNLPMEARVFYPGYHFYHSDRTIVTILQAGVFLPGQKAPTDEEVLKAFRGLGVTHVLTRDERIVDQHIRERYGMVNDFIRRQEEKARAKAIYSKDGIRLFALDLNQ